MRRSNTCAPFLDSNSNDMDAPRIPVRSISTRSNLFSRNTKQATARSNLFIFAVIVISFAVLYFLALTIGNRSSIKRKFRIVIDGGSTGSRIHVFEYVVNDPTLMFALKKDAFWATRVNPGLSSYVDDPSGAGVSLMELLMFAKGKVPEPHWANTEIRLMATAGLRILNPGVQEKILDSCRKVLRASGFLFHDNWASVITGYDEGIYAWVVANYALGALGGDPLQTTGIIELGGASVQVTFVSDELIPAEYLHTLRFGGTTYNLYSHSFLHLGQNVAFESLQESLINGLPIHFAEGVPVDPCSPKGYFYDLETWKHPLHFLAQRKPSFTLHGRGNFSECRFSALMFLQRGIDDCPYEHCYLGPAFLPKLRGKFLATENFFYTSKFFGLTSKGSLLDLMNAGQQFCEVEWSTLKKRYPSFDDKTLLQYCFSSAYIVALLHDSLGVALNDDPRMEFTNEVDGIPLDWAFGAFILQSRGEWGDGGKWIATLVNEDSPTLLAVVLVCFVFIVIAWSFVKWKKPRVKTIYDLQKGRYIFTRVTRK